MVAVRVRLRYAGGDQAHPGDALEILSGIRMPMTGAEVAEAVRTQGEKPDVPAAARYAVRNGLRFGRRG